MRTSHHLASLAVPLAAVALLLGGGRARADAPCLADAARLCPGLPAGGGRLYACLVQNQFQVSSACQKNLREVQRRASELHADCAANVYQFCPGLQPGGGRVLTCLSYHLGRRELSSNCEEAVIAALEKLQEFSDACGNDAANLCQGVPSGGGQLFACLRSQSGKLSSRCKRAVNP
jgi:golgi apparatus protein 1